MTKAVVDVGSNSVLLAVATGHPGAWETVYESTAVTGLGTGTKESGLIGEPGATQTLEALQVAFDTASALGAESVFAGGTMALRIAKNADCFLERAKTQGTPVTVVSGEDEARLGFLAVAEDPAFSNFDTISIIDPGGHSTELVTAFRHNSGWKARFKKSFPIGALGLAESTLDIESPGPAELLAAVDHIDKTLGFSYLPNRAGTAFVLGATGTNLISIRDQLTEWQPERVHGQILDYEEVSRAVGWLCGMTEAERRMLPGLERGRERTIHIGALILERFLQAIAATECRVSVRGWRHAIFDHPLT